MCELINVVVSTPPAERHATVGTCLSPLLEPCLSGSK